VDKNDVRPGVHLGSPFLVISYGHLAERGCDRGIRNMTAPGAPTGAAAQQGKSTGDMVQQHC
jgi:hypothetical protein